MSDTGNVYSAQERSSDELAAEFRAALGDWQGAIRAHEMAAPDPGFAGRLAHFAAAARSMARACRAMERSGYLWPPTRKAESQPPYELRPGTGRRGPQELWRRYDRASDALILVAARSDLAEVADAYDDLAAITEELARAVAAEDAATGTATRRTRSRRSA